MVIAHPGHELRVYHWLSLACPSVFILTDGSGNSGESRLHSTTNILEQINASCGCIYGSLTDVEIYSALMTHDFDLFLGLTQDLAAALVREEIDYVVGDAIEGYNPSHDVCRYIINAAVEIAGRSKGRVISNFDILLTSEPGDYARETLDGAFWLDLDSDALRRKLAVALGYSELAAEVQSVLESSGVAGLKTECLRRASNCFIDDEFVQTPYYELYGEQQVAAGHYKHVLRYREHVLPVARALRDYVEHNGQKACEY